jgi:hypothetical protein
MEYYFKMFVEGDRNFIFFILFQIFFLIMAHMLDLVIIFSYISFIFLFIKDGSS